MEKGEIAQDEQFHLFFHNVFLSFFLQSVKMSAYGGKRYLFPNRQILDPSKLKVVAGNNSKFDENGEKFARKVKNNVGKGEISRHKQISSFPTVLLKDLFCKQVK